jgi:hypothetical protein
MSRLMHNAWFPNTGQTPAAPSAPVAVVDEVEADDIDDRGEVFTARWRAMSADDRQRWGSFGAFRAYAQNARHVRLNCPAWE